MTILFFFSSFWFSHSQHCPGTVAVPWRTAWDHQHGGDQTGWTPACPGRRKRENKPTRAHRVWYWAKLGMLTYSETVHSSVCVMSEWVQYMKQLLWAAHYLVVMNSEVHMQSARETLSLKLLSKASILTLTERKHIDSRVQHGVLPLWEIVTVKKYSLGQWWLTFSQLAKSCRRSSTTKKGRTRRASSNSLAMSAWR